MKTFLLLLVAFQALALGLAGCAPKQSESNESTRPACVTLPACDSVIQQVMGVSPVWGPMIPVKQGHMTSWEIQDERGTHVLSVILTRDECVCVTAAASQFVGSFSQGELAGYLQGAAVAPVSDLSYTANWLEPKVTVQCPLAFLFRRIYRVSTVMPDATTWELACARGDIEGNDSLVTSLTITSPTCLEMHE